MMYFVTRLNGNDFTGRTNVLAQLKKLQIIDLSQNKMTGSLFDPTNLTELQSFKASTNKFSGAVPEAFSDISPLGMCNRFILSSCFEPWTSFCVAYLLRYLI